MHLYKRITSADLPEFASGEGGRHLAADMFPGLVVLNV